METRENNNNRFVRKKKKRKWVFGIFKFGKNVLNLLSREEWVEDEANDAMKNAQLTFPRVRGADIAQWICLCLPSCGPGVQIPSTQSMLFPFVVYCTY